MLGPLRRLDETQRFLLTLLVIFVVFFGLSSLLPMVAPGGDDSFVMHFQMSLSFVAGMAAGLVFYFAARPGEPPVPAAAPAARGARSVRDRNLAVLRSALSDDERALVDIIKEHEGVTQDSLRFRTGFSKSKVSAVLTGLEGKGILNREKVGKTYKLSIGPWLASDGGKG